MITETGQIMTAVGQIITLVQPWINQNLIISLEESVSSVNSNTGKVIKYLSNNASSIKRRHEIDHFYCENYKVNHGVA